PAGIVNRLAEVWVPLLAIADLAGGEWPDRARQSAAALAGITAHADESSVGVRLLAALRDAIGDREAMWAVDPPDALNADDEAPWGRWNDGAGITALDLSKRLAAFKVHRSDDIKIGGKVRKGYRRAWFEDAWKRYCTDPQKTDKDEVAGSDAAPET